MVDKTLQDHIYWIPSRQIKQVPLNGSTYSKQSKTLTVNSVTSGKKDFRLATNKYEDFRGLMGSLIVAPIIKDRSQPSYFAHSTMTNHKTAVKNKTKQKNITKKSNKKTAVECCGQFVGTMQRPISCQALQISVGRNGFKFTTICKDILIRWLLIELVYTQYLDMKNTANCDTLII